MPARQDDRSPDPTKYFHIIVLDAGGREILNEAAERPKLVFGNPPAPDAPYAEQVLVDADNDRFVLRLVEGRGAGRPGWRVYRLSTGELIDRFLPETRMVDSGDAQFVIDSRLIRGTPLILVHWFAAASYENPKTAGARFTLVETNGRPVWVFDAPEDYATLDLFERASIGVGPEVYFETHPAILPTSEPNRFKLRLFARQKYATFEVKYGADTHWAVTEVERGPYHEPPLEPASQGTLRDLGELTLCGTQGPFNPYGEVRRFTFDRDGNLCILRLNRAGESLVLVIDPQGRVKGERPIGRVAESFHVHWADTPRLKDDRFVLLRKGAADDAYAAWLADLKTGLQTPFKAYPGGPAESLARLSDGGCVVLGSHAPKGVPTDRLACYDAEGKLLWEKRSDHPGDWDIIGNGPLGVAITTEQTIVLLNMNAVHLLDRQGKGLKRIDLTGVFQKEEFGGRPLYLQGVVADADGGFLIQETTRPPVVVRYGADGSLRSRWSPHYPDGRTFDTYGLGVAPDGRVWTTDGGALLRLTDDGVVDLVVGDAPAADRLDRVAGFVVDGRDQLYAVAYGTGAVHVFDRDGRRIGVCVPRPGDMPGTVMEAFIAVTDHGEVYVGRPHTRVYSPPDEYLHFDREGKRLGIVTFEPGLGTSMFGAGWAFQPGTGYRCGLYARADDEKLLLVDPPNKIVRAVERRPGSKYFSGLSSFAMAPDGSMVVLSTEVGGDVRESVLDLFSPTGEPRRALTLPLAHHRYCAVACDGRRAVVVESKAVLIVNLETGAAERWDLAEPLTTPGLRAFLSADGKTLLIFDPQSFGAGQGTIHRYELP